MPLRFVMCVVVTANNAVEESPVDFHPKSKYNPPYH